MSCCSYIISTRFDPIFGIQKVSFNVDYNFYIKTLIKHYQKWNVNIRNFVLFKFSVLYPLITILHKGLFAGIKIFSL